MTNDKKRVVKQVAAYKKDYESCTLEEGQAIFIKNAEDLLINTEDVAQAGLFVLTTDGKLLSLCAGSDAREMMKLLAHTVVDMVEVEAVEDIPVGDH